MTVCNDGHSAATLSALATDVASPINAVAPDIWMRYSMSLATSSVMHGQKTMPLRSAAVAISHHCGTNGRMAMHTAPAGMPNEAKTWAARCDCHAKCV